MSRAFFTRGHWHRNHAVPPFDEGKGRFMIDRGLALRNTKTARRRWLS